MTKKRRQLPDRFDPTDPKAVTREYEKLEKRDLPDAGALENWILDWEELGSAIHDRYSRAHVATTVDTTDEAAEKRYFQICEEILPLTETFGFKLNRKLLSCAWAAQLDSYYDCYVRAAKIEAEIFREKNVGLKVEERKLVTEFEKIMGGMSAVFRGRELTMQQLGRFLEEPDRATRREAYETRAAVRRQHAAELDALYDKMLDVRRAIAANADFASFRDYQFAAMHRFDYAPADCFSFHDAIAKHVVPAVSRFHAERRRKLGLKRLAPWDTAVDPDATEPIRPFEDAAGLIAGCRRIFGKVDPELAGFFETMVSKRLLDLDSRKGKAPGGYCTQFPEEEVPFIFMNAAGTKRDVDTLLHEGGHSFHYFLAAGKQKLASYHATGLEFAEVASMAMELLARPHFGEFYAGDALGRVKNDQLKKILEFFPFMAMIDAFQHWVYTEKGDVSAKARRRVWAELEKRFQPELDWTGFEDVRDLGWQYPHVFSVPFYYVEYGIAQLGALAVWVQSLENHKAAVERYKSGLRLGGSRPLPELFAAVGARFGMSGEIIEPLVSAVQREVGSG